MAGVKEDYKSEDVSRVVGGKTGSEAKEPKEVCHHETTGKDAEKGNN